MTTRSPRAPAGTGHTFSIGYITAAGPAEPYVAALQRRTLDPVSVHIGHVDLMEVHRDRRMYEWRVIRPIPLRGR